MNAIIRTQTTYPINSFDDLDLIQATILPSSGIKNGHNIAIIDDADNDWCGNKYIQI